MKTLLFSVAILFAAGCTDTTPPMNVNPTACGTVTSTGMVASAYGCAAVSLSTQAADLTRVIVNSSTMDSADVSIGSITVNLKGLVHALTYKTGDNTLIDYKGSVTRVSDGVSWTLAYDSTDASKTQGSLTLAVKMFEPDPDVDRELDLHGHLTATYAAVPGQSPAPPPLTLDLDY